MPREEKWKLEKHTFSCQYFGRLQDFSVSVPCWKLQGERICTHLLAAFSVLRRGLRGPLGELLRTQGWSGSGQMSGVSWEMKAKHEFSFERLSFVVVRSPWLWDSHRARNNFCVLLKRIQNVFQIWIECVCLKNYFLCKSCWMCEMICLSNCPSKETQA